MSKYISKKFWLKYLVFSFLVSSFGIYFISNWRDASNLLNTLIGIFFTLLGVYFTLEIFALGNEFNTKLKTTVQEIKRAVLLNLKHQYIENIRHLVNSFPDNSSEYKYWKFVWRFESFDNLSILIKDNLTTTNEFVEFRILSTSVDPMNLKPENRSNAIYTVRITSAKGEKVKQKFKVGEKAYCSFLNGKYLISEMADNFDLEGEVLEFIIAGLGEIQVGWATAVPEFRRMIDIEDI